MSLRTALEAGQALCEIRAMARQPAYASNAVAHLRKADPVLRPLIDSVGDINLTLRPERFQALVRAIIFQQLAGRAAQAIYDRFVALFPGVRFPKPSQVLNISAAEMRKAGLSDRKAGYLKDLAAHIDGKAIDFRRFPRMNDEEIIQTLTRIKGIGRWTAEMFLMFNMGRPDVLPVDDLGFAKAAMRAYGLAERPKPDELRRLGERWRPYRSAAVWYLWQSQRVVAPG